MIRWVVGCNLAGFLPDPELVSDFRHWAEARDALLENIERDREALPEAEEFDVIHELARQARPGSEVSLSAYGIEHWIQAR